MKKLFTLLLSAGLLAGNIAVIASPLGEVEPELLGDKISCYLIYTHGGDKSIMSCTRCVLYDDISDYSVKDTCNP